MNTNQYYDMKRMTGADLTMSNMNYLPQYATQPQIQMYTPMVAAQPYQASPMMMTQQGYFPFGVNPQSMKRDAPQSSLMVSDDKNGKKANVNSSPFIVNRMLNSAYSVAQYPAMTMQYTQPQVKPAMKEPAHPVQQPCRVPKPTVPAATNPVEPSTVKVPDPKATEAKPAISDMERTVAAILCGMKVDPHTPSQPSQSPAGAKPAPEGAVSSPSASSTPAPTMPAMSSATSMAPMAPMTPTAPATSMAPMAPMASMAPVAGSMAGGAVGGAVGGAAGIPIVPSAKMSSTVNCSAGVPPIPSPPAGVLANTLKTMVCGSHPAKEEAASRPVELRTDIIPELKPDQLLMSRRHVHVREKPVEAPAPSAEPTGLSGPSVQSMQSMQSMQPANQPVQPVQPAEEVEKVEVKEEVAVKEEATPIVPSKTEEEEVPLMRVPSAGTQEEEKVVPIMPEKEEHAE